MTSGDVPPWGTPDGDPPDRSGTPGAGSSADPSPDYGTPDHGSPPPPTGDAPGYGAAPDSVLTVGTIVVVERPKFMSADSYELYSETGAPLGTVFQEASMGGWVFGGAATATFRIIDTQSQLVASIVRPGSFGRSRFVVTDAGGAEIGTIEQENAFFAPHFLLTTADGLIMRLTGGQFGAREWQLVDGLDEDVLMGRMTKQWAGLAGLFTEASRFAVQLSPQLVGPHRLLALAATIGLGYVQDAKRRRG